VRERPPKPTSIPEIGSVELVVALRRFPGAAELHASELAVLASVARPRRLAARELLAREGTAPNAIVLVLEGEVAVRRRGDLVERARPGSAIGVLEALARDPRGLECVAEEPALVLSVSLEDLEDVFEEVPSFLVRLVGWVGRLALQRDVYHSADVSRVHAKPVVVPDRPLDLVERILHLRNCPAFAKATIDAVAALADVAGEVRVAPEDALWRRGSPSTSIFVIVAGELEVTLDGATHAMHAGDLAGQLEAFASAPHPTDAVARSPLVALSIEREALFDTWEDHTDLGVELLRDANSAVLRATRTSRAEQRSIETANR